MRIYTGRERESRRAFFVFAKGKQEAIDYLASEDIEVDEQSLRPVRDAGAVLFRPRAGAHPGDAEELKFEGELPWSECA